MIKKDNLLNLIGDLVQDLREYGKEDYSIIALLLYYGFTREQACEYYGLIKE
jgi:hypothetical protein